MLRQGSLLHLLNLTRRASPLTTVGGLSPPGRRLLSSQEGEIIQSLSPSGLLTIRLNRPSKFNAITTGMYQEITETLNRHRTGGDGEGAGSDGGVKMVLLTGTGPYYSAGNDLSAFASITDPVKDSQAAKQIMNRFLFSFIDFDKPIVCGINGPAIGIMTTSLGLMDVVWAKEGATFSAPFSATAQSPEGCSSLLFPTILGKSMASEVLMFNRQLSTGEALQSGLISRIISAKDDVDFRQQVERELNQLLDTCSAESMATTKRLIHSHAVKEHLKCVAEEEADQLVGRWLSADFPEFIFRFLSARRKK